MLLEQYNEDKHFKLLTNILKVHEAHIPTKEEMPKLGYVVYSLEPSKLVVSFCFIRMVEGNFAMIDGLTSNPECSSALRNRGNDLAINACIDKAKTLKLQNLIAFTSDPSTKKRSIRRGFVELQQHTCLALDLSGKV